MTVYAATFVASPRPPKLPPSRSNSEAPRIAGVKNGRPAIESTMRNQRATLDAPMIPATVPSRVGLWLSIGDLPDVSRSRAPRLLVRGPSGCKQARAYDAHE